eukprot:2482070-Prymnesium_polylepis.1
MHLELRLGAPLLEVLTLLGDGEARLVGRVGGSGVCAANVHTRRRRRAMAGCSRRAETCSSRSQYSSVRSCSEKMPFDSCRSSERTTRASLPQASASRSVGSMKSARELVSNSLG